MKKNIVFIFIVAGLFFQTFEVSGKKKKQTVDFWPIESSILQLFGEIRETKDDSLAYRKHKQIEEILAQALVLPSAFKHKFDSLKAIGRVDAPHKKFRIFNWNQSNRDGTHHHFAIIVIPGKKGEPNKVIHLTEIRDSIARPDQQTLGIDQWIGCLYYKIIPKRKGKDGKKYYTLLGTDMNNLSTKKKIIEILSFNENGEPQFGAPIIELNGWTKHRVIFEFAAHQYMYLEYNCLRRRIEFDHLSPLMPYLVGEYEYYEPDLYRDGLKFKRGHWKHSKDIKERPKDKKLRKNSLPKPPKIKPVKEKDLKGAEKEQNEEEASENETEPPASSNTQ